MSARFETMVRVALFALGYWLLRAYCFSLPAAGPNLSYVWLPDGLVLGVLLSTRLRQWPPYLLAVVIVSVLDARRALGPTLLGSTFNIAEPALVAYLLTRVLGMPARIDGVKAISILYFGTIVLMAGATLATTAVNWLVIAGDYWIVWKVWYVSDTLGMLIVAPLIVAWAASPRPKPGELRGLRLLEAACVFAGLVAATHFAHTNVASFGKGIALAAMTAPFLVWAGLRFGVRGATLGMALYALQCFWYAAYGLGHFARNYDSAYESVIALQLYLVLVSILLLLPSALLSERRRALTESADWRRRYESLLVASNVLTYEVATGARNFVWGGNVQEVLGIAPENIRDVPAWIERMHPDDRHLLAGLRERFASGEVNSLAREYRVRRDDGSYITVGVTAYGLVGDERTDQRERAPVDPLAVRVVGFVRDISERRRAEREKGELEERLRQSEKMEAIGRFADGIAHDFNNILGAILGYGELAKAKAPAGSDLRRYLETIYSAGERGRSLVAQLLTFSRSRPAEKRPLRVTELLDEVVVQLKGALPEGISIRTVNESPAAVVLGEATQLHQMAMNLCTNAVQAMPAGGEVGLSVRVIRVDGVRAAQLGVLQPANYVEIEVKDAGQGIAPETAARIFEPFFTTKPVGRGTGLGLSVVRSVVLEHEGALDVASAPGQGTRVSVYLPEAAGASETPAVPEHEAPRGSGQAIMVVDDEPALVMLAQELLAELGYEAIAFVSGADALRAYERDPARFDAVLSDELMPELTGTQLAGRLRRSGATLPILIVSGYGGQDFEARTLQAGVNRVLRKPYRKLELADALAALLATRH